MTNPYEILHLEEDATYQEIKERYRHLTRSLHPDKQPLQNYQASKKLFQQIDEAYKSIASPLRRFLFKEYGLPALKVLDEMPGEFHQFDKEELNNEQIARLKQLMIYLLYERQACFEMDKTKFVTKSLINVSKTMRNKNPNMKKNSKRNTNLPELQNASFEYQMVLPEVYGFSNSIALSHFTTNIRSDPKYTLMTTFSSVRRLYTNYMLTILTTVSAEDTNIEMGFDKICENNLHLKFTPISIHNLKLGNPKFGIEKAFNKFNFSAITDLQSVNFDFTESSQQRLSKSLKIYIQKGSLAIVPKLQYQLNNNLRLFVQLSTAINYNLQQNNLTLRPSLLYGYKLNLGEDLKLELASSIGSPNYYQITFINSKFRASIPLITGEQDLMKFEVFKVAAFLAIYAFYRLYHERLRRNQKRKIKMMKEQENRLKEQKRELTMQISYVEMGAADKKEREVKYNGLVILRALLGEEYKIKNIEKRMSKLFMVQEFNDLPDEVEDITVLVQNEVVGSQIINYDLQQLLRYNPCIYDSYRPYILLYYSERGDYKTKVIQCRGKLSLGGFCGQYEHFGVKINKLFRKTMQYVFGSQSA